MNKTIQGALIAFFLQIISMLITLLFFDINISLPEIKSLIAAEKSFLFLTAIATIPNVVLFFYMVNKNALNFAKGVQIVIILIVLTLAIIKFT